MTTPLETILKHLSAKRADFESVLRDTRFEDTRAGRSAEKHIKEGIDEIDEAVEWLDELLRNNT